jgi:SnoaL-like domain
MLGKSAPLMSLRRIGAYTNTAKGICYWSEIMPIDGRPGIVNMGHYEDVLKKVDGKWKFAKRTIVTDVPIGTMITAAPPAAAP